MVLVSPNRNDARSLATAGAAVLYAQPAAQAAQVVSGVLPAAAQAVVAVALDGLQADVALGVGFDRGGCAATALLGWC